MNPDDAAYFDALLSRIRVGMRPRPFAFAGAESGTCHDNAERFAAVHPGHFVVPGWLVTTIEPFGQLEIVAHSVVRRRRDGELLDVTPIAERDRAISRSQ